ncbi:MAG: hypothetical protein RSB96_00055, partial [Oscillospiraceae bacterium]
GVVTVKSNSIIPAIIIHFINNGFAVMQSYMIVFDKHGILLSNMGFIMIGTMIAAIFILIISRRNFNLSKGTVTCFTTKELYQGYFTAIGVILFLAIMVFNVIITLF